MCSIKHINDAQDYCVNLFTFLLNAMINYLIFSYGNYDFPHKIQVLKQLKAT